MNASLSYADRLKADVETLLRCSGCFGSSLSITDQFTLCCDSCGVTYPIDKEAEICSLLISYRNTDTKENIRSFWGDLYKQLYADIDGSITSNQLSDQLSDLEDMFVKRQHLAAVEMPLADLAGKKVLDIGAGSGAHSCLFRKYGADIVAVDLTPERVLSTAKKLSLVADGQGIVYQADAEHLPFRESSFDIVYSNGVLHHSENTEKCLDEVYRVLRPGGQAIIMLYARHSAVFWLNIFLRGLLSLRFFYQKEAHWVGYLTEGKPKFRGKRNPVTRIFSRGKVATLFSRFDEVSMRRSSFQLDNFAIPKLTQVRCWVYESLGINPHPGGILVYGRPYMCETPFELRLGKLIGWCWNIKARKPISDTGSAEENDEVAP
ncbi:MAG: hypothetical protein CMQ40_01075 [Gammaproteobacteria bacterium]|nr:hypothetical protein [Gammaproteobacteria bacterium]